MGTPSRVELVVEIPVANAIAAWAKLKMPDVENVSTSPEAMIE